jgi:hypothetical protein
VCVVLGMFRVIIRDDCVMASGQGEYEKKGLWSLHVGPGFSESLCYKRQSQKRQGLEIGFGGFLLWFLMQKGQKMEVEGRWFDD